MQTTVVLNIYYMAYNVDDVMDEYLLYYIFYKYNSITYLYQ